MAKIGAQMFTLREHCKTVEDIARCCERVKAMGYDGIQASASGFSTLDPDQCKAIKKACDDNGLAIAATHEGLLNYDDDQIKACIEKHQIFDCKLTAVGGFSKKDDWTRAAWDGFITSYNILARKFDDAAVRIGYHNHSHEFAPLDDGSIPLQLLVDELDDSIWFEFDVYWVAHGLGDPAAWISKTPGRCPALHYKDGVMKPDRTHLMCEVGNGNLNWPAINKAAADASVKWYLVERDNGELDPFESLEISIKNMRAMGL